jgi:hypothetical protein
MKNKFKIPVVPSTVNKCIRMPENLVQQIEKAIEGKNSTFTAFVIEACKHALEDIDE